MTRASSTLRWAMTASLFIAGCAHAPVKAPVAVQGAQKASSLYPLRGVPTSAGGNRVELFVDGREIVPQLLAAIRQARGSIQLHAFILAGEVGDQIAAALVERRKAGVAIQVLFDPGLGRFGSIKERQKKVLATLDAGGVPYRLFPLEKMPKGPTWMAGIGKLCHTKLLVVDGKLAFVGGMNFYDEGAKNHDYMSKVEGPSATQFGELIQEDWLQSGPATGMVQLQPAPNMGKTRMEWAQTGIGTRSSREFLASRFDQARKRLWVEVLFMDDDTLLDKLAAAKKRGVDVKVILDPIDWGNHVQGLDKLPLDGIPNWAGVQKLLDAQIPVAWFKRSGPGENLHAKICVIDEGLTCLGSANYTYRSFDHNREVVASVQDAGVTARFAAQFQQDLATKATPIAALSVWQRALSKLFDSVKKGIYSPRPHPGVEYPDLPVGDEEEFLRFVGLEG